jgi:hypothetical protein
MYIFIDNIKLSYKKYFTDDLENKIILISLFAIFCQNLKLKSILLKTDDSLLNDNLKKIKNCIKSTDKKYNLQVISNLRIEIIKNILDKYKIVIEKLQP